MKNQENNRLENQCDAIIIESINMHVTYLQQQLEQIQAAIDELCSFDIEIRSKINKLTSIPGMGIVLATNTICQAPEIGNIEFSQLTSLVGLAPYARESGNYRGQRSVFAGRGNLRKVLYMAAVASLRCNHKLKAFYDRLIHNHNPPKVALVAVMRKLLAFMHAIIKNDSSWNSNYA